MTNSTSRHWTEEQISDYLIGETVETAASVHLDACVECQAKLDQFQHSMAAFSSVSREWSEHAADRMKPVRAPRVSLVWVPTAAWAFAAALAIGVGLPIAMEHRTVAPVEDASIHISVASVSDENSDAAIAHDNAMMMAVANELNRNDPMPLQYVVPAANEQKRRGPAREE